MKSNLSSLVVGNNPKSVKTAAEFRCYSLQYLRWLLRSGKLEGFKKMANFGWSGKVTLKPSF